MLTQALRDGPKGGVALAAYVSRPGCSSGHARDYATSNCKALTILNMPVDSSVSTTLGSMA